MLSLSLSLCVCVCVQTGVRRIRKQWIVRPVIVPGHGVDAASRTPATVCIYPGCWCRCRRHTPLTRRLSDVESEPPSPYARGLALWGPARSLARSLSLSLNSSMFNEATRSGCTPHVVRDTVVVVQAADISQVTMETTEDALELAKWNQTDRGAALHIRLNWSARR